MQLRTKHVPAIYENEMNAFKRSLDNKFIYLIVDETVDSRGDAIVCILIGVLECQKFHAPKISSLKKIERANASTICQLVNDDIFNMGIKSKNILVMATDAAPYGAGKALKLVYLNIVHVTCLAHGMHRVAVKLRELSPLVNKLVNNGKKVFLKAPRRVEVFKSVMPNISLPPEPIVTRWGTWIEAALYYAKNLENFCDVMEKLEDDSEAIRKVKNCICNKKLKNELSYILCNLEFLPQFINKMETRGMLLSALKYTQ